MARRRAVAISAPPRVSSGLLRRIVAGILVLVLACLIALLGAAGFFTLRITTQYSDTESVTPATFIVSNYEAASFTSNSSGEHDGWLLRGHKGFPVIILCPGYDLNRADLLSLGVVLQANHFNVYVFNFHGPKTKSTFSNLGIDQAEDLQSAIEMLTKLPDINPHRVGVFGQTTGGYAAFVTAEKNPLIKAVAVDSIYERPEQMFDSQLDQLLGGPSIIFRFLATKEFQLLNFRTKKPPVRADMSKLANIPKLFISGGDTPLLASITEDLYNAAPDPKSLRVLSGQAGGAEKKEYENEILSFFDQNLPLGAD